MPLLTYSGIAHHPLSSIHNSSASGGHERVRGTTRWALPGPHGANVTEVRLCLEIFPDLDWLLVNEIVVTVGNKTMSGGPGWVKYRCHWPPGRPDDLGPETPAPLRPKQYKPCKSCGACPGDQPQGKRCSLPRPRPSPVPARKPQPARSCSWGTDRRE